MAAASSDAPAFPFARERPLDPPDRYAAARTQGPAFEVKLWNGERAWLITRYEDVRRLVDDPRFSGEMGRPDFPAVTQARVAIDKQERAFVGMDNPAHDRYRRLISREFTARRMQALEPRLAALAERLVGEMIHECTSADLYPALAVKFPSLAMCELIGSPYEDHAFIIGCAAARHGLTQTAGEAHGKARELVAYFRALIDRKEAAPADDMTSRIIAEQVAPGRLSRDDFAEIGAMLLRAGHDTTTNMIGMGAYLLATNERLRAQLVARPELMAAAVEELLRYVSPVQYAPRRVALEDVQLDGMLIRKGDGIFPLLPAANRDPSAYPDPDRIDFERNGPEHVAFGHGIHQCIGQTLARIELRVLFTALLARVPRLRLAVPPAEIRFKHDMQIYGVYNLPVTW